jgi:hypothetical protein
MRFEMLDRMRIFIEEEVRFCTDVNSEKLLFARDTFRSAQVT